MALYYYEIEQRRPEVHPHYPKGMEELETEDIKEAARIISGMAIGYDVADVGDKLVVHKIDITYNTVVSPKK